MTSLYQWCAVNPAWKYTFKYEQQWKHSQERGSFLWFIRQRFENHHNLKKNLWNRARHSDLTELSFLIFYSRWSHFNPDHLLGALQLSSLININISPFLAFFWSFMVSSDFLLISWRDRLYSVEAKPYTYWFLHSSQTCIYSLWSIVVDLWRGLCPADSLSSSIPLFCPAAV